MKSTNTSKLPKWAQEYIQNLERERDLAIRELNDALNAETESPIYVEDLVSTGEEEYGPSLKRWNIQSHKVFVDWGGVHMSVYLRKDGDSTPIIDVQYGAGRMSTQDIVMQPRSFQNFWLFKP